MFIGTRSVSCIARELDDAQASTNLPVLAHKIAATDKAIFRLDEILKHDQLFSEYPEIGTLEVRVIKSSSDLAMAWIAKENRIEIRFPIFWEDDAVLEKQLTACLLQKSQNVLQVIEFNSQMPSHGDWKCVIRTLTREQPEKLTEIVNDLQAFVGSPNLDDEAFQRISKSVAYLQNPSDELARSTIFKTIMRDDLWDGIFNERVRKSWMAEIATTNIVQAMYLLDPAEVEALAVREKFESGTVRAKPSVNVRDFAGAFNDSQLYETVIRVRMALTRLSIQTLAKAFEFVKHVTGTEQPATGNHHKPSIPDSDRHQHNQNLFQAHSDLALPMTFAGLKQMRAAISSQIDRMGRTFGTSTFAQTAFKRVQGAYQVLKGNAHTLPDGSGSNLYKQGLEQANKNGMVFMREAEQNMQVMRAQPMPEQPGKPS